MDTERPITLTGAREWRDFVAANADALHAECVDLDEARTLARRGDLRIGGGSAPLFVVTLTDARSRPSGRRAGTIYSVGGQA